MTSDEPHRDMAPESGSPYLAPASEPLPESVFDSFAPSGSQVRPWVRFWARSVDESVFGIVVGKGLLWLVPALDRISDLMWIVLVGAAYLPCEAALFTVWGTTPGKALLNIRVCHQHGARLSFRDAMTRCARVWLVGEWLGLHLPSLIGMLVARGRLIRTGITAWDEKMRLTVIHREVEWWRWLVLIFLHVLIFGFLTDFFMLPSTQDFLRDWWR